MNLETCLFCKIAKKEIPSAIIYEDKDTLAFMDIGPIIKGHALVIPKSHYDPIHDTPDEVLAKLIKICKKIATAQKDGLGAEGCNIIQNNGACSGQEVPHLHFHVIPRFENDGHHWNWAAKPYAEMSEMQQLAERINQALKS
jgi:histidine triad (HIT) family protein